MYEHKRTRPLSRPQFARRMAVHVGWVFAACGATLAVGVLGYHSLGGLAWVDALLNASMILGGMGPVDPLPSDAAKVFASAYALFSGLVFIGATGVILAPVVHRVQHKLHWDDRDDPS